MKRGVAGAPPPSRRKPFSSKQKKQQLKEKRERKREKGPSKWSPPTTPPPEDPSTQRDSDEGEEGEVNVSRLNQQPDSLPLSDGKYDPNRYRLHFEQESKAEIEQRKRQAKTTPLTPVPETSLEVDVEDIYQLGSVLDIPRRPSWSYEMSKAQVERREEEMFEDYLRKIHSKHRPETLSYFEHNLETWRQLWRVLELSDVVLLITDIRHPALHFSPALYNYVVSELQKQLILILNKVDLVPPPVAVAWRHYFLSKFPELKVVCFTSYPSLEGGGRGSMRPKRRRRGRLPAAVGTKELFAVIKELYEGKVDLTSWEQTLVGGSHRDEQEDQQDELVYSDSEGEEEGEEVAVATTEVAVSPLVKDSVQQGVLTIGMIGHPNVGKSSLLNGLVGKKVVSTSRTPGHTKHFQTIFLTPSVRLCDCPGLVFPSLIDKQLQVLSGIYPIAQVREPYTAVGYLAERLPLIQVLRLVHPDADPRRKPAGSDTRGLEVATLEDESTAPMEVWTAWDICDAWAEKRGFRTSRAARLDTYRAANSILRLAVEGRVNMYFRPPGYFLDKANWECHPEVAEMLRLQREGLAKRPLQSLGNETPEAEEEGAGAAATKHVGTSGNKFSLLMALDDINL